jgi:hypothetical protein
MAVSLVDYLNAKGYDNSKEARRHLWQTFRPDEEYKLTAEQNEALLRSLELDNAAPRLELTKQVFQEGETITAKVVSESDIVIESDSAAQSMNASPGDVVTLGAAHPGVYAQRIVNAVGSRDVALLLLPMVGVPGLSAVLLDTPGPLPDAAAPSPTASDIEAVKRYLAAIKANPAILTNAAKKKLDANYVAEHVADWQGPATMCLIALLPALGAKAECAIAAGGVVAGIAFDVLEQSIDEAGLTPAEVEAVKRLLVEPVKNFKLGTSLGAIVASKDTSDLIENGAEAVAAHTEIIEAQSKSEKDLKLIISVITGFVGTVALLIKIKP